MVEAALLGTCHFVPALHRWRDTLLLLIFWLPFVLPYFQTIAPVRHLMLVRRLSVARSLTLRKCTNCAVQHDTKQPLHRVVRSCGRQPVLQCVRRQASPPTVHKLFHFQV